MHQCSRAVSILLFLLIVIAHAHAQTWENLKTLKAGERIQVVSQTLKSHDGRFLSYSEEAISFLVGQQEIAVPRADVLRVSSRAHMSRTTKTLIGLGIGAGAGLAVGAIAGGPDKIAGRYPEMAAGLVLVLREVLWLERCGHREGQRSIEPNHSRTEHRNIAVGRGVSTRFLCSRQHADRCSLARLAPDQNQHRT